MKQVEQEISEKMSQAVHHFPVNTSQSIKQSPITGTGSRKRSATCLQSREEILSVGDFFNLLNLYRLHPQVNHQMLQ